MSYVDLRVHSNASDGILSPEQVVRLAHEAGLSAIALTDHDATAGVAGAAKAEAELGLGVVPGIKVPSSFGDREIHTLGLSANTDSPSLRAMLKEFRHHEDQRDQGMLGRFDTHGIHLTVEDLCTGSPGTAVVRVHVARALLTEGLGPDSDHIFKKYLQYEDTYCPPEGSLPPEAVIEVLLDSRALMALAHPFQYKLGNKATGELITYLADLDMKGLEVYHSSYNHLENAKLQEMATRHHLLFTGGSDFHGNNRPDTSIGTDRGGLWVFSLLLDAIKDALQSLHLYGNS